MQIRTSILAAVALLSVGLWMHRKSIAGRWQRYVNERPALECLARSILRD
jgi:high-affinity iron transporter